MGWCQPVSQSHTHWLLTLIAVYQRAEALAPTRKPGSGWGRAPVTRHIDLAVDTQPGKKASNTMYRDLYISGDDWHLEVEYRSGDRWIVTSPNPNTLEDIRDQQVQAHGDDIVSTVIAKPSERTHNREYVR